MCLILIKKQQQNQIKPSITSFILQKEINPSDKFLLSFQFLLLMRRHTSWFVSNEQFYLDLRLRVLIHSDSSSCEKRNEKYHVVLPLQASAEPPRNSYCRNPPTSVMSGRSEILDREREREKGGGLRKQWEGLTCVISEVWPESELRHFSPAAEACENQSSQKESAVEELTLHLTLLRPPILKYSCSPSAVLIVWGQSYMTWNVLMVVILVLNLMTCRDQEESIKTLSTNLLFWNSQQQQNIEVDWKSSTETYH